MYLISGRSRAGRVQTVLLGPQGDPQVVYLEDSPDIYHGFVAVPWHAVEYVVRDED